MRARRRGDFYWLILSGSLSDNLVLLSINLSLSSLSLFLCLQSFHLLSFPDLFSIFLLSCLFISSIPPSHVLFFSLLFSSLLLFKVRCGPEGNGYDFKIPTHLVKVLAPALRWGLLAMKIILASQGKSNDSIGQLSLFYRYHILLAATSFMV